MTGTEPAASSRYGVPTCALSDGTEIPSIGLGVWQVDDGRACLDAVSWALELGYRHVDTAQAYGNEASVGAAIARSGLSRERVFVTTKFNPRNRDPAVALEQSLERLGLEHVDLYLVHWPAGGATWAWPGMERAHGLGHARSIGVSNFSSAELDEVLGVAAVRPVVNQIQLSPFRARRALVEDGRRRGLVPEAYSPLGTGRHLSDATVRAMAERLGRPASQVLLAWSLQHGFVALPKSTHREYLEENLGALALRLSDEDVSTLDALDTTTAPGVALERKWW